MTSGDVIDDSSVNRAAALPDQTIPEGRVLKGMLTARKGASERRPRGGPSKTFSFSLGEWFAVLRGRISSLLGEAPFTSLVLDDERVYFRASKGAAQNQFIVMTEENFSELLVQRVKRVPRKERQAWGNDVIGNLQFEFYVYCRGRVRALPTIHRATASGIRRATRAVERYQEENGVSLGPIALMYVITTHARQPDTTEFQIHEDNTTRQAMAPDEAAAQLEADLRNETTRSARLQIATIRLEVNNSWNDFRVDVASLQRALGLPTHDILCEEYFTDLHL